MSMIGVPLKTVVMFHADSQNETITAEGWEIADGRLLNSSQQDINPGGTYQLPDLRNYVPIGADITAATAYAGDFTKTDHTGAPGPKGSAGANVHTNSVSEMVSHNHTATDSGHAHGLTTSVGWVHGGSNTVTGVATSEVYTGGHDLFSMPIGMNNASANISVTNTGGGTAYDIRQRSYGLVFIMKVRI